MWAEQKSKCFQEGFDGSRAVFCIHSPAVCSCRVLNKLAGLRISVANHLPLRSGQTSQCQKSSVIIFFFYLSTLLAAVSQSFISLPNAFLMLTVAVQCEQSDPLRLTSTWVQGSNAGQLFWPLYQRDGIVVPIVATRALPASSFTSNCVPQQHLVFTWNHCST